MEKREVKTITSEFVLSEKEARRVLTALDYCFHRLTKHEDTGLHGRLRGIEVNEMRKTLRELLL